MEKINVTEFIKAERERVFEAFTVGEELEKWYSASPGWSTPYAYSDLKEGGELKIGFKDPEGKNSFDYIGYYTEIIYPEKIAYRLGDERLVEIEFIPEGEGTRINETFDADGVFSSEKQKEGWKNILKNLKVYLES